MREIGPPAVAQVHDRERDLAHHVDPAHLLVELDAVEDRERAVRRPRCCRGGGRRGIRGRIRGRGAGDHRAARRACSSIVQRCERIQLRELRVACPAAAGSREVLPRDARGRVRRAERVRRARRRLRPGAPPRPRRRARRCRPRSVRRGRAASLARAPCGNSRIFTAYSMAGPSPPIAGASTLPVIATTSR